MKKTDLVIVLIGVPLGIALGAAVSFLGDDFLNWLEEAGKTIFFIMIGG
jgi:hypothetical protein